MARKKQRLLTEKEKTNVIKQVELIRDDPDNLVRLGHVNISSPYSLDANGNQVENASAGNIARMQLNNTQMMLHEVVNEMRKCGQTVVVYMLKSRRVGGSTYIQARLNGRLLVNSGYKALTIAHSPKGAQTLYDIGRFQRRYLPFWLAPKDGQRIRNSQEAADIENDYIGTRGSFAQSFAVTETGVENIRGSGFNFLHYSECAFYKAPDKISAAMGSLLEKTPTSEAWYETTGNGRDVFFYPKFMPTWEAQGGVAPWERGAIIGRTPAIAVFFPWYVDVIQKRLPLHPEVSYDWLEANLDEEEDRLFRVNIVPQWEDRFSHSPAEARKAALEQLYWRRCRIDSHYTDMAKGTPAAGTLSSMNAFRQEEPATPEEAFSVTAGLPIADDATFEWMDETVRDGEDLLREHGGRFDIRDNGELVEAGGTRNDTLWLWKDPRECSGNIIASIDFAMGIAIPNPKEAHPTRGMPVDFERDFYEMTLWEENEELNRIEQIGGYLTQEQASSVHPKLARFLLRMTGARDKNRWAPRIIYESSAGHADFLKILTVVGYPLGRIYRKNPKAVAMNPSDFGFFRSRGPRKETLRAIQKLFGERRMVIRDPWLLFQLRNYVEKDDGDFQARMKTKGGSDSKDDGAVTATMAAYWYDLVPEIKPPQFTMATTLEPPDVRTISSNDIGPLLNYWEDCRSRGFDHSMAPGGVNHARKTIAARTGSRRPFG